MSPRPGSNPGADRSEARSRIRLRLEPLEFVDAGDQVATRLRFHGQGRASGARIEEEMYHQVTTFCAGRIVRIEYFGEWAEALEAARLPQ